MTRPMSFAHLREFSLHKRIEKKINPKAKNETLTELIKTLKIFNSYLMKELTRVSSAAAHLSCVTNRCNYAIGEPHTVLLHTNPKCKPQTKRTRKLLKPAS